VYTKVKSISRFNKSGDILKLKVDPIIAKMLLLDTIELTWLETYRFSKNSPFECLFGRTKMRILKFGIWCIVGKVSILQPIR